MTEAEWLVCDDPARMNLTPAAKWWGTAAPLVTLGPRRVRLLAVACARLVLDRVTAPGAADALAAFERYADGAHTPAELREARRVAESALDGCRNRLIAAGVGGPAWHRDTEFAAAVVLREAGRTRPTVPVGNRWAYWDHLAPHGPVAAALVRDVAGNPFRVVGFDPAWRTSSVVGLASAIYAERAFDRMPILADALQDAGCEDAAVLAHCRGPGPHIRGCWVVDLAFGKE